MSQLCSRIIEPVFCVSSKELIEPRTQLVDSDSQSRGAKPYSRWANKKPFTHASMGGPFWGVRSSSPFLSVVGYMSGSGDMCQSSWCSGLFRICSLWTPSCICLSLTCTCTPSSCLCVPVSGSLRITILWLLRTPLLSFPWTRVLRDSLDKKSPE